MSHNPEDQTVETEPAVATQEDFPNPGAGFVLTLGLGAFALMGAMLSTGILTLPLKANAMDADSATTIVAVASTAAGVTALVGSPIFGRLSDRTTSRWGRRRPYLVLGAALVIVGALLVLAANSTAVLAAGWVAMTLGQVSAYTALGAAIPDQLSVQRRGVASALFGVSGTAGAVLGLAVATAFSPNLAPMILVPAALAAVFLVVFAVVLKDKVLPASEKTPFDLRELLGTFWVNPLKAPSFAYAFGSRFAVFCAIAAVNAYMALYLIMGLGIPTAEVSAKVFLANLVSGVLSLVVATIAGKVSDKVGRRKPFVIASAGIFAVGLFLIARSTSFEDFLIALTVTAIGQGVYLAVDFALITQVLPDPANAAKDLGIMNLASSLPNILVPAVAPTLLAIGATVAHPQNFGAFFLAAAIAGVLGALLIVPIRGVR